MESALPGHDVAKLVEEHYELLYRYAYRLSGSAADAEDLAQQTFLIAQSHRDQLRDIDHARGWLCTILRHAFLKSRHDHGGIVNLSLESVAEPADAEIEEALVDSHELQAALLELPEEFRSVIVLFYFGDFSYKAIAEQLDVPIGTVMSRLARGKAWLRKRLSACQASNFRD